MEDDPARRKIFDMVQNGDITAEEGLKLIKAFSGVQEQNGDLDNENHGLPVNPDILNFSTHKSAPLQDQELKKLRRRKLWWLLPFGIGLIITLIGAFWMYSSFEAKGLGWGFWLSWFPFLFGIIIMVLSGISSKAKWLHLKIHEKDKNTKINISLPLPLGLTHWVLDVWGDKIPQVKNVPIGSIVDQIETGIDSENPLYVHVDDDDDEVEILIE